MESDQQMSSHVAHRHFAAINTGWKRVISSPALPGENDVVDKELLYAMHGLAAEQRMRTMQIGFGNGTAITLNDEGAGNFLLDRRQRAGAGRASPR